MKLLRYGPPGQEKPALVATDGSLRDLSLHVLDISPRVLDPKALGELRALDPASLPKVEDGVLAVAGSCAMPLFTAALKLPPVPCTCTTSGQPAPGAVVFGTVSAKQTSSVPFCTGLPLPS